MSETIRTKNVETGDGNTAKAMSSKEYRITQQNAKALDYPEYDSSVAFWMAKGAIVFEDTDRSPNGELVPVVIRTEYQVWMSAEVLEEVKATL